MSEPRVSGHFSLIRDALGALGILTLAAVLGLVVNAFHPRSVSFKNPGLPAGRAVGSGADTAAGDEAGPRVISADTLQAWLAKGTCVLLDAREPEAYAASHIPGARNLPLDFVADSAAVLQHLPKDVWLVCYCDGPPCDLGERLAYELQGWGFTHVAVYEGGMADWRKRGGPTEKEGSAR